MKKMFVSLDGGMHS